MKRFLALLVFVLCGQVAFGQAWSGIVAPSRAVDWSKAGVVGGIPTYTTIYQTLSNSPQFPASDWWMPASGSTTGTTVTTAILGAWATPNSECPAAKWSIHDNGATGPTANITVGASQRALDAAVVANGVNYPSSTTVQSIAVANNDANTYVTCNFTNTHAETVVSGYFVDNHNPVAFGNVQDAVRIDFAGGFFIMQYANSTGSGYCVRAHGYIDGITSATCTPITQGHVYFFSMYLSTANNQGSIGIYDPSNNFNLVGSVMTLQGQCNGASCNSSVTVSAAQLVDIGNAEVGVTAGTTNYFQAIQVQAGVTPTFPGIPTSGTLTTAAVNSALSTCPAGEVVLIPAGTYNGLGPISWSTSCVLRGAGADQTLLQFTSVAGGCGSAPLLCMQESGFNSPSSPENGPVNVTGTVTQGSTTITLASVPNLKVGHIIILDECPEGTSGATCTTGTVTDNGGPLETDSTSSGTAVAPGLTGPYSGEGNTGNGLRTGRMQAQVVTVTQCDGNSTPGHSCASGTGITISPGLYDADWNTSKSPQAWWATNPFNLGGVEDLSVDASGIISNGLSCIAFHNAYNSWVKGVRTIDCQAAQVTDTLSEHLTMQRSYHYLTQNYSIGSYGYGCYVSSDNLVENNIFQAVASPRIYDACEGTVFGYNFDIFNFNNTAGLNFNFMGDHGPGADYNLNEGNEGNQLDSDWIHGTHGFNTDFRDYLSGPSQTCWLSAGNTATSYTALSTGTFGACTSSLSPVILQSFGRFYNEIGGVYGKTGTNTTYNTTGSQPVYTVGQGGTCSGCVATVPNDPNVATTAMFWGVSDPTNGGAGGGAFTVPQFNSAEVPTGLSGTQAAFANSVPATHVLPASFYYSSKPPWWPALKPWPIIGPDVTGGNVSGVNGLVYTNGAQDCYNLMGGPANGVSTTALTFNENTCFPLVPTASTPSCAPGSGTYSGTQSVTCTASTGPTICWRVNAVPATNGTTGCAAGSTLYTGAITVSSSETLQVIAGGTGYNDGSVVSYAYTITGGGTTPSGISNGVRLSGGATIR